MSGVSDTRRLDSRVREIAKRHPDKVAFHCRDDTLTYAELIGRADGLGKLLVESGITPLSRVGVFLFKHVDMPVAVYGTLAARCTYVPIDPLTVKDRLATIIDDCDIGVLICDRLTARTARSVVADRDVMIIAHEDVVESCRDASICAQSWPSAADVQGWRFDTADNLDSDGAYLIYTSGSTGTPKGILHSHRSALAYVDACLDTWDFGADDHFANHSPLHFDMATMEFLVAPSVGATTTLLPEDVVKVPVSMAQQIESSAVTVWYSVPYALMQLMDCGAFDSRDFSALRHVIFAGEAFPMTRLRELISTLPEANFANAYGPTETNVCTVARIERDTLQGLEAVPIGHAWSTSTVRVESIEGVEVDDGEMGELLVAGEGVMTGYWARPELNARCFVQRQGRRFYRTGDLVHIDQAGVIHLHGRTDRQIKHRGFRIELDEIESLLHEHPDVSAGAVLLDNDRDEIVGVICVQANPEAVLKSLQRLLRSRLPGYAVPARLLLTAALPRSANNKIDRVTLSKNLNNLDAPTLETGAAL